MPSRQNVPPCRVLRISSEYGKGQTFLMIESNLRTAARWIREARSLIVTAGAGMGVDSGLPDFRGPEGFWRAYPALRHDGIGFHDIATPEAFCTRPQQAWGFYGHRLALYRKTVPHAGFHLLREIAEAMPEGYRVFTSNVDGQFQQAEFDPASVHECHGSIHMLQCLDDCNGEVWSASYFEPVVDERHCLLTNAHLPVSRGSRSTASLAPAAMPNVMGA